MSWAVRRRPWAGTTEAAFTGLAQGARYDASVVAVNAMEFDADGARPITTTKLIECAVGGDCLAVTSGYFVGPTARFTLSAPGWDGGAIPHIPVRCVRIIDNGTATVRVDGVARSIARGDALSSADVFNRGQYIPRRV